MSIRARWAAFVAYVKARANELHWRTQVARLARLFGVALLAQPAIGVVMSGHSVPKEALTAALVAASEVAYRQFRRATPDDAPVTVNMVLGDAEKALMTEFTRVFGTQLKPAGSPVSTQGAAKIAAKKAAKKAAGSRAARKR